MTVKCNIRLVMWLLTAGNTALRGNEGSNKKENLSKRNFIRTVKLLADFDPVLHQLYLMKINIK